MGSVAISLDAATSGQIVDSPLTTLPDVGVTYYGATDMQAGLLVRGGMYYDTITVIGVETGDVMEVLHQTGYALALSTDGKRLASSAFGNVLIWNLGNLHLAR